MSKERLEMYTAIVPSDRQKTVQDMGFYAFLHYGINTFIDKEWSDGKAKPELFGPSAQDTDQWVSALKSAGAKGAILTAKHHDGFCLWQTKTTNYSVASSPYKAGKGDVVKEVQESCEKYGLKFGIYLSPWDRNSSHYGTDRYNDFYIEQLTELLTGYGDIFCVWLDGACGAHLDGKACQRYDFDRIYQTVRRLQPNAVISNCGPDVRWVGNEGGYARKSEWNVVPAFSFDVQTIASNSQTDDDTGFRKKGADIVSSDLGSREFLRGFDAFMWYPSEVDVSIRPGWFYHKKEDGRVRSLENLMNIYYNSVGGNSLLLLNVPPDRRGLVHEKDVARLAEVGEQIKLGQDAITDVREISAGCLGTENSVENCLIDDEKYYSPDEESKDGAYEITVKFSKPQSIDKIILKEQTDFSQRIEKFSVYAKVGGKDKLVYKGTTVGYCRMAVFKKPVYAEGVKIVISECRLKPYIKYIAACKAGAIIPKKPFFGGLITAAHHLFYRYFVWNENRKNK